jgi:HSP20 family protein
MALVSWNPWPSLETLKRDIDRLFDTHAAETFGDGNAQHPLWAPRLDLRELDHAFIVEADLPGMSSHDIAVSIEKNTLVIAGERQTEQAGEAETVTYCERLYGPFQRALMLPTPVEADRVEAAYHNGVLTVTVPKAETAKTKHIAIKMA